MNPIEATVRLIENWNALGTLSGMNAGQVFDLTQQVFELFSSVKPKREKKTPKPVHIDMSDDKKSAGIAWD